MTVREVKQITHSLGHTAIANARAQYEADLALLYAIFDLTDYLADWDAAIEENEFVDTVRGIEQMFAVVTATEIK